MKKLLLIFLLNIIAFSAYSVGIINPIEGQWANKQTLVLDIPQGSNAYYSLNGLDPESSGFAYDGPVLIDLDGKVNVSVVIVLQDGSKKDYSVNYEVNIVPVYDDNENVEFLRQIQQNDIINYQTGTIFSIPQSLEYSFDFESNIFEEGTQLSISKDSVVSRYIPCTIKENENYFRFVINVIPTASGLFSRKDVPFYIENWETIHFTDNKKLYKIDDQWWSLPKTSVKIDRSVSHMISWQDIDYSQENSINFFVLPAKPEIKTSLDDFGMASIKVNGEEGFKIGIISDNEENSGLFDSITIDTFKGDSIKGTINIGIFYDSVYQGKTEVSYNVHKKIPKSPTINLSEEKMVSRFPVKVSINTEKENTSYYTVQGPVVLNNDDYSDFNTVLTSVTNENYKKYNGTFVLKGVIDNGAVYKIKSYSLDEFGNKSKITEKYVIIDQCNYYIDENAISENADGSKNNPFKTFEECLPYISSSRFVKINMKGNVLMPKGNTVINSNCQIIGVDDCKMIMPENSRITIRNSSFILKNLIIESNITYNKNAFSFLLEHSVLDIDNCEILSNFNESGTIINADNSVVVINNTGLTVTSKNYASVISSINSRVSIKQSRFSSVSNTSVVFSLEGGIFDIKESSCKVIGNMGRIAELFDTHSSIVDNSFIGELRSASNNTCIYKDSKNITVKESGNEITGF